MKTSIFLIKNLLNYHSYNNIIIEMNQANNLGDDILVTDLQDQAKLLQQKFLIFQRILCEIILTLIFQL